LLNGGCEVALCRSDRCVDVSHLGESAEVVNVHRSAPGCRNRVGFSPELPVMLLNPIDVLLKGAVERNALCAQYQLVKVLPLLGFNSQAGVDIFVDEGVIEDDDVW
jgi:hypothetical protein